MPRNEVRANHRTVFRQADFRVTGGVLSNRGEEHTQPTHTWGWPFSFGLASVVRRVAIEVPHRRGRRTNFDLSKRRRIPRIDLSSSGIRRVARAVALACMAEREPQRGALHRWQAGRVCSSMNPYRTLDFRHWPDQAYKPRVAEWNEQALATPKWPGGNNIQQTHTCTRKGRPGHPLERGLEYPLVHLRRSVPPRT